MGNAPKGLDRETVAALATRCGTAEAARRLKCSEATVRYHCRRAGVRPAPTVRQGSSPAPPPCLYKSFRHVLTDRYTLRRERQPAPGGV